MFTNNILNKVIQKTNESDLEEINKYQEKFDKILNQLDNLKSKLYIYVKTILQLKQNNNNELLDFDDIYHIAAAKIKESDHTYSLNFHIGGKGLNIKEVSDLLSFDENLESFIIKAEIVIPKNDEVVGTVNYIIKTNQSKYESDLKYALHKYELLSDAYDKLNIQLESFDKAMYNYIKKCEIKEPYICNWFLNNVPQTPIIFEGITKNNISDTEKIAIKHILEKIDYDEPASISRVRPFRDYLEEENISIVDLYNTDKFKIVDSNLKPELENMILNYHKLIKLNTPTDFNHDKSQEEENERF